ncbi:MAG: hypothetical protein ACRETW_12360, partial [Stenotrophobium sp.]
MSQGFMDCQWQSMLANAKLEAWPGRSRKAPEARDVTKVGTPPHPFCFAKTPRRGRAPPTDQSSAAFRRSSRSSNAARAAWSED